MSIEKLKNVSIHSSTPDLSFLFDIKSILKDTPDKSKLSVTLKHQPIKGNSLFATKSIKVGDIIAYYKMKVFTLNTTKKYDKESLKNMLDQLKIFYPKDASKCQLQELFDISFSELSLNGKGVDVPFKDMYQFEVVNKSGKGYDSLIGDLYKGSISAPKNNIPYWGYFANEPFPGIEVSNAEIDYRLYENFTKKNRSTLKEGDVFTYALVATRPIKAGDEILWYYESDYDRSYKVGKC